VARNIDRRNQTRHGSHLKAHHHGNDVNINPLYQTTDDITGQLTEYIENGGSLIETTNTSSSQLTASNGLRPLQHSSREAILKESDAESVSLTHTQQCTNSATVTMDDSDLEFFDALDDFVEVTPVTMTTDNVKVLTVTYKNVLTSSSGTDLLL